MLAQHKKWYDSDTYVTGPFACKRLGTNKRSWNFLILSWKILGKVIGFNQQNISFLYRMCNVLSAFAHDLSYDA